MAVFFDFGFGFSQANAGILLAVEPDGRNFPARNAGQVFDFRRETGRRRRWQVDALMFEQGIQLLLQQVHFELQQFQVGQVDFRTVRGQGRGAAGENRDDDRDNRIVFEFENCKQGCHRFRKLWWFWLLD